MDVPEPMLPTTGRLPLGQPGWRYEFKWDGIRVITNVRDGDWRLWTRHGRDITARFPELAEIAGLGDVLLDGELIVLDVDGLDFGAAISRLHTKPARALAAGFPAAVLLFDVLRLDGVDLRRRPYTERRAILRGLDVDGERWSVPPAFEDGEATVEASLEHGLEGVVAKRASSPYVSGRSRLWIKSRHKNVLDVVVAGWVRRPSGGVTLLLAEATPTGLLFVGRCTAPRGLAAALEPLAVRSPPVTVPPPTGGVHWVRPVLQVEVTAASRGPDGRLRQPRFVRARLDEI